MSKQGTFLGMPYDWRPLTTKRLKSRFWNKNDKRLFTPKVLGWGYDINLYELLHHRKKLLTGVIVVLMVLGFLMVNQIQQLHKAHSSFENYYAFRGCAKLIKRSDTYGICKTNQGKTIKIVKFQGKWYLDGDLPCGFLCF